MTEAPGAPDGIALVVADVDGTLVTPDKALTDSARAAVRSLSEAGIAFTLVSSRPPRGMSMLVHTLNARLPIAAFNGSVLLYPDQRQIQAHRLSVAAAETVLDLLARRGVTAWVFADDDWRLRDPHGPRPAREYCG